MDKRNTKPESRLKRNVDHVLSGLYDIKIQSRGIRKYRGSPKVKISEPWPPEGLPISVCDEHGEQEFVVLTKKRIAMARIIRTRFEAAGIALV